MLEEDIPPHDLIRFEIEHCGTPVSTFPELRDDEQDRVVAAITDFLDGQIARRTNTVSWVGKIMDPIMDRLLLFTGVLGLVV